MKLDRTSYQINIAGLVRDLPIVQVADNLAIASFVMLGDAQLCTRAAEVLRRSFPSATISSPPRPRASRSCRNWPAC